MVALRPGVVLLMLIYLGFISLGLPDGTFGVAWPVAHAELDVPLGLGGTVVLVATLLSAVSGFASGAIIARYNTGPVMFVSCLLTGGALLLIAEAPRFAWLLVAAAPLGLGAGAVDAGLNGYVARHYSGRHMNWLHACWGIGATCGPLILARALATGAGWRGGYLVLGAIQLSLAVLFLATLRLWSAASEHRAGAAATRLPARLPTAGANSPAGWLSVLIFTLYVSVEITAGVWAASILVVGRGISQEIAGLCAAAYYGAITVGRVAVGFVADRWSNRGLVAGGMAVAFLGTVLFALARDAPYSALALILLGLGFSPVYPGLMYEVPRRFAPAAVQVVIGRQSGAAYVGAASLPAAAGWIAQRSLESLAWVLVGGVLLVFAAIHRLNRIT
jgi:MFS family permease